MNKQTPVENKIRELVPELMELSFGCEIDFGRWGDSMYFKPNLVLSRKPVAVRYIGEVADKKIIGHPIHLEHVLRAMKLKRQSHGHKTWSEIEIDTLLKLYNLTKPFSEQSPELYQFLAEVLGV